jgi:hypothetical protein
VKTLGQTAASTICGRRLTAPFRDRVATGLINLSKPRLLYGRAALTMTDETKQA